MRLNHKAIKKFALGIVLIFFLAGLYWSMTQRPGLLQDVDLAYLGLILGVGIPAAILINSWEYSILSNISGVRVSLLGALEITVMGSAANMLPLPGAAMVRVSALKAKGISIKKSSFFLVGFAILWVAVALIYSGVWMEFSVGVNWAPFLWVCGFFLLVLSMGIMFRFGLRIQLMGQLLLQKFVQVVFESLLVYWALVMLSFSVDYARTTIFVIAGFMGSAISIIPAGLGVREGVSALLAPLVEIEVEAGFLSAAANRILSMIVLGLLAGILLVWNVRSKEQPE